MHMVVTGSLGNISKPLTQHLVKREHAVTVINRRSERSKKMEALVAKVATGSMENAAFNAC